MKIIRILFFLLFVPQDSFCITFGSNYFVSQEEMALFPQADSDNAMKGFATFGNGFRLEDSQTTSTFNAYYPVGGQINLSGGTLVLENDLSFDLSLRFIAPGNIVGNNHIIDFPQKASSNLFVSELDNEQIRSLHYLDSYYSAGIVNGVDWSYDGNYVAAVTNNQPGNEIQVLSFNGTNFSLVDSYDSTQDVYKVRWHPSLFYFAAVGSRVGTRGVALYRLSGGVLTETDVQDLLGDGHVLAWHPSGAYFVTGSDYPPGELKMWDFNSIAGTAAIKQTVNVSGSRSITALSFSPGGSYLAMGILAANSDPTLLIYQFNGSVLTLDSSVYTGAPVQSLDWSPTGTYIAVGMSTGIERLRVYKHNAALSTVTAVTLSNVGEVDSVLGTHWSKDGNFLLYGASSAANAYKGACFFNKDTEELLIVRRTFWPISNGHSINDIRWSPNNNYVAYGDDGATLNVDRILKGWPLQFNNTSMVFKSNINVNSVWKFSGNCVINGGLYDLAITDAARIEVASGAHVTFKDVVLKNICTSNFFCLANNSSITFDNSSINLSRDFTFTNGSLLFQNDVTLAGTNKFTYSSRVTSTIDSGTMFYLDTGMTFSYDPPINNKELLYFVDDSSYLHLRNATLHATKYGMRLLNGGLMIEGLGIFESESPHNALSYVEFGNQNVVNDFTMKILSGAVLELADGKFVYRNINPGLWAMDNSQSLIDLEDDSIFQLQETLELGIGRLLKYPGSTLIRDSGSVKIIGAVNYSSIH